MKRPLSNDKSLTPSTTPSAVIKATGPVPGGLSLVSYDSEDSDTDTWQREIERHLPQDIFVVLRLWFIVVIILMIIFFAIIALL